MKDFIFYLTFDDGRHLTVTVPAYGLISACMLARRQAFDLINKVWLTERKRLVLSEYMVK